ncbi:MAG: hypothetical protein WC280_01210 [Patescibacteria group bacterium]
MPKINKEIPVVDKIKLSKKEEKINNNLELLETDLIKDQVPVFFDYRRHLVAFFVLLLVSFAILIELFLLLTWWGEIKKDESESYLKDEINYVISEKSRISNDYEMVLKFKNDASISFAILDNHIYWSNFLDYLEKNTLKAVYYRNFSGNINGIYTLPSVTKDVRAISYQSQAFNLDEQTSSVNTSDEIIGSSGISASSGHVNFNLNLNLRPRLFKK